jgi:hypothetical protein
MLFVFILELHINSTTVRVVFCLNLIYLCVQPTASIIGKATRGAGSGRHRDPMGLGALPDARFSQSFVHRRYKIIYLFFTS